VSEVDHCTAFIEGWWAACCASHDSSYAEQIGRLLADDRLWSCVTHSLPAVAVDNPVIAAACAGVTAVIGGVMWLGVRVFGGRFYDRSRR
jgi:hypothetical protein